MGIPAVQFDHVSKKFYLGKRRAFVRELLPGFLARLTRKMMSADELWALNDVSFEAISGEALGIIGSNGSGKTTTLSLLAGITTQTRGRIETNGTIGALIQLGAGFHPELTGRENVYLNASILGVRKKKVDQIYDEIVEFAELAPFMNTAVKRYSSGMYARLGFSVAAHLSPDILLVDEVLAVGDLSFQTKCIQKMMSFVNNGKTVIFVSHNLNMVQSLCNRVMWLDEGRCVRIGTATEVISAYFDEMDRRYFNRSLQELQLQELSTGDIRVDSVVLRDGNGEQKWEFQPGDDLVIELNFETVRRILRPYFWIGITGKHGAVFGANMLMDGIRPEYVEGSGVLKCTFRCLPLMPQVYNIRAGVRAADGATMLIASRNFATFRVVGNCRDLGFNGEVAESLARDSASVLVPYEWRLPDGQTYVVDSKARLKFKQ